MLREHGPSHPQKKCPRCSSKEKMQSEWESSEFKCGVIRLVFFQKLNDGRKRVVKLFFSDGCRFVCRLCCGLFGYVYLLLMSETLSGRRKSRGAANPSPWSNGWQVRTLEISLSIRLRWDVPHPSSSWKWRFRSGSPTKNVILVVTAHPNI